MTKSKRSLSKSATSVTATKRAAAPFVDAVTAALAPLRDRTRATAMVAYMKGHFPFLGVPTPARRSATKVIAKPEPALVLEIVRDLWRLNEREYHYVALDLLDVMAKKLDPPELLALIEELALDKSWWDSIDGLAGIGSGVLRRAPQTRGVVDRWSAHNSFWVNRLAILHQNGWGAETNPDILFKLCLAHSESKEFFIRKAIGWALREYAWTEPEAVRSFVQANASRLSPLSAREALKNIRRVELRVTRSKQAASKASSRVGSWPRKRG